MAQIGDRAGRIASIAAENSTQVVDGIVPGRKFARAVEALAGKIEVTLAQGEESPVGPGGGLAGAICAASDSELSARTSSPTCSAARPT